MSSLRLRLTVIKPAYESRYYTGHYRNTGFYLVKCIGAHPEIVYYCADKNEVSCIVDSPRDVAMLCAEAEEYERMVGFQQTARSMEKAVTDMTGSLKKGGK